MRHVKGWGGLDGDAVAVDCMMSISSFDCCIYGQRGCRVRTRKSGGRLDFLFKKWVRFYNRLYLQYDGSQCMVCFPVVFQSGFLVILRGAILNRTYGTHKNLCISLFFTNSSVWSYLLWPPVVVLVFLVL